MSVLNTFDIKLLPKNVIHIRDKETEILYIYERDDYSSQTNKVLRKKIQDGQFTYEIQGFELHVKIILGTKIEKQKQYDLTFDEYIPTDYPDTDVRSMKREICYLRYKLEELSGKLSYLE
jgi:hypothetical protein